MPESIESFVKKLQSEGLDAGKKAAEKILKESEAEAEKILAAARAEAEKILSKAKDDAEKERSRGKTEMELAARDTILKLCESIEQGLSAMVAQGTEKKLSDPDYLGEVIREIAAAYAEADANQKPLMEINISKKMRSKMTENVLKDLFRTFDGKGEKIALKSTLATAGFEYRIRGATVEVSPDSLSEIISEMVSPGLREVLGKYLKLKNQKPSKSNDSTTDARKANPRQTFSDKGKSSSEIKES